MYIPQYLRINLKSISWFHAKDDEINRETVVKVISMVIRYTGSRYGSWIVVY